MEAQKEPHGPGRYQQAEGASRCVSCHFYLISSAIESITLPFPVFPKYFFCEYPQRSVAPADGWLLWGLHPFIQTHCLLPWLPWPPRKVPTESSDASTAGPASRSPEAGPPRSISIVFCSCALALLVLRLLDSRGLKPSVLGFSGLWTWTKLYHQLPWVSSKQMADYGTS